VRKVFSRREVLKTIGWGATASSLNYSSPLGAQGKSVSRSNRNLLITVQPLEISDPLSNPFMGWGLWTGIRYYTGQRFTVDYNTVGFGDDAPLFNWVLIDWMWSDLEPKRGVFEWEDLDTIINYWSHRKKQIELRVWVTDDPGWNGAPGNMACPVWLWEEGVRFHRYVGEGHSAKREPDYTDPSYAKLYLPELQRLLTTLAERYDKEGSPVTLWGVMGYGQWGEWHTLWSHFPWPSPQMKHEVLSRLVRMYANTFKYGRPSISYCFDWDNKQVKSLKDFMYRQALDVAVEEGFALARHGFIDGLDTWDTELMRAYWRDHPMWAEGNWSYTDIKSQGTHGTLDENLDVMLAWHSNYAHFYMDAASYKRAIREDKAIFERGLCVGGLGYRLVPISLSWPSELSAGQLLVVRHSWVNRNVGRLYVRHLLKLYLTDARGNTKFSEADPGFDPTSWVCGQTYSGISVFHLPKNLTPGTYDVRIALVDLLRGEPSIQLGILGQDSMGRYKLGEIRILVS
jgi:hypothetical protein